MLINKEKKDDFEFEGVNVKVFNIIQNENRANRRFVLYFLKNTTYDIIRQIFLFLWYILKENAPGVFQINIDQLTYKLIFILL